MYYTTCKRGKETVDGGQQAAMVEIECAISNRRSSNKKRRSMVSNRWTSTIERVVCIYGELVQTNRQARAKSNGVM